jgi:phosphoglycolate phosphatase
MLPARAVIFDLDGTLVDSLDDISGALARALGDAGLPPAPRDAVRRWIGGGARNLIAQAVAPDRVDEVLASFRRHYDAAPAARTTLFPGVAELLDELARAGIALAVLSNKPHDLTVQIADVLLAAWPFRAVVGHRSGAPLKPDPAAALELSRLLGVPPPECALVGDASSDIATARAAGMRPIAVTWGFRPRHELVAAAPDAVADDPGALTTILRGATATERV